jgi:hypothetical protein
MIFASAHLHYLMIVVKLILAALFEGLFSGGAF